MSEDLKAVMAKIAKDKAEREAAQKAEEEADALDPELIEMKKRYDSFKPKSEQWIGSLRWQKDGLQERIDEMSVETSENKELLAQAEEILLNEPLGWDEGGKLRQQIIWTKAALEKLEALKVELAEVDEAIKIKEEAEKAKNGEQPSFEETLRRHSITSGSVNRLSK